MAEEMLLKKGSHLKTKNLIEQAGYTINLARENFTDLEEIGLTGEFLTETDNLRQSIIDLEGKQESAKGDVKLSTEKVGDKVIEGRNWVKKAKLKAKRTFRLNQVTLKEFINIPYTGNSVPELISAMAKMIELQKKYDAELQGTKGGTAFAEEGEVILNDLQQMDSQQELIKTDLPASSKELYLKQGQLFFKLKDLNDMGQEAFIDNSLKARNFNMSILKR